MTQKELIAAVKAMKKKEREALLEDLLAATSPEYLSSIREARADYKSRPGEDPRRGLWRLKFQLVYTQRAIRDIKGLDPRTKKRIGDIR